MLPRCNGCVVASVLVGGGICLDTVVSCVLGSALLVVYPGRVSLMNYIDLLALTLIGQSRERRFSCMALGCPIPDRIDDYPATRRAMVSAREAL